VIQQDESSRVDTEALQALRLGFDPFMATPEDAWALQEKLVSLGMQAQDPCGPFFQAAAACQLETDRLRIEGGDGFDALKAVALCAVRGLVMPDWLAQLFLNRYREVQQLRVGGWGDPKAFGPAFPKGTHLAALRRGRRGRVKASLAFTRLIKENPSRAIDKGLWEEVGREIGEGATQAENLYREALKQGMGSTAAEIRTALGAPVKPTNSRKLAGVRRKR
jgi:hypothetical protein